MKAIQFFSWSGMVLILLATVTLSSTEVKDITLRAQIEGCGNTLYLYTFDGFQFVEAAAAQQQQSGYEFQLPATEASFYYLGPSGRNAVPVILGAEAEVVVKGSCDKLRQLEFTTGGINVEYAQLKTQINDFQQRNTRLIRALQGARSDQTRSEGLLEQLKELDAERLAFLEELRQQNSLFADIAAVNTYLSYPHHGQEYDNEVGYYADSYFKFADFSSAAYNHLPWTYESFSNYTSTLSSVGLPDNIHQRYIEKSLDLAPAASPAQKMAFAGVLAALRQKKHPNYTYFADLFIERFREVDPKTTASLKKELMDTRNLMVGGTAPDFTQETPDGEALSLSELRGKVILIDFWASWCGPCRRENPNVVRAYQKYRDKGFDIISVSLDKDRNRWLQAIEKDGMDWHHVSDLKGWKNEVAQTYGVTSIPHTILLDAEGKIVARNLRGPSLDQKLAQILE